MIDRMDRARHVVSDGQGGVRVPDSTEVEMSTEREKESIMELPEVQSGFIIMDRLCQFPCARSLFMFHSALPSLPRLPSFAVENKKKLQASRAQLMEQQEKVEAFELRRRMKSIVVPVLDDDVRKLLRRMNQPITLFGEREMERRSRAQALLASMSESELQALSKKFEKDFEVAAVEERPKEVFYTEGTEELKTTRIEIARFSLQRARDRLEREKMSRVSKTADRDESTSIADSALPLGQFYVDVAKFEHQDCIMRPCVWIFQMVLRKC